MRVDVTSREAIGREDEPLYRIRHRVERLIAHEQVAGVRQDDARLTERVRRRGARCACRAGDEPEEHAPFGAMERGG